MKEYDADPGTLVDVDGAYMSAYDDVVVGAAPARAQVNVAYNVTIPLGAGANWLMITIVPYNAYQVGIKGRAKATGGGAPAAPLPPTARANVTTTATSITNSVTMPTPVPTYVIQYRDNVNIGIVLVTVAAGAVQNMPADASLTPSTPYSYTYSGYTGGVESTTRTAPLVVTTSAAGVAGGGGGTGAIPTPTLVGSYDTSAGAFQFDITPGDGTTGITWTVERSTTGSGGAYSAYVSGASTSLSVVSPQISTSVTWWFRAIGRKTGFTDSLYSAVISVVKPRAGGGL